MKTIQCAHAPILLITTMALWRHAGYGRPELLPSYVPCFVLVEHSIASNTNNA